MGKGKKRARLQLCPASKQGQVDALDGIQAQIPLWTMQDSGTRGSAASGKVANSSPALCSRSDTHSGLLQAFFFCPREPAPPAGALACAPPAGSLWGFLPSPTGSPIPECCLGHWLSTG